jgi:hypothetical protein
MRILGITLPIFLLIGAGYALRALAVLRDDDVRALNAFVYRISLPAAIIASFFTVDWTVPAIGRTMGMNTLVLIAAAAVLLIIGLLFRMTPERRAALFMCVLVGNTVYMGFPIGERAFGPELYPVFLAAATPHIALGLIFSELMIAYTVLRDNRRALLRGLIRNPLVLSLAAGVAASFLPLDTAGGEVFRRAVSSLAATASPLALVALGAFLYHNFAPLKSGFASASIALKLIGFPAALFALGAAVPALGKDVIAVSAVAASMPTAVSVFVLADNHRILPQEVAGIIFWSTILSLATVSGVLAYIG